jgi:hypothetical protein
MEFYLKIEIFRDFLRKNNLIHWKKYDINLKKFTKLSIKYSFIPTGQKNQKI